MTLSRTLRTNQFPAELTSRCQWVVHRSKQPFTPDTGRPAKANDPATWGTYSEAIAAIERGDFSGIGFEFADTDPFVGIDLDNCRDAATGFIEPWAQSIVEELNSYTEVSPSGTGLHIIVQSDLAMPGRKKGNVEMYAAGRYFTMTGDVLEGHDMIRPAEIEGLFTRIFGPESKPGASGKASPPRPNTVPLSVTNDELLARIRQSPQATKFSELWEGDTNHFENDHSTADAALVAILYFWTGGDETRTDQLFRQSGLMRPKWDEQRGENTYGQRTITFVIDQNPDVYKPSGTERITLNGNRDSEGSGGFGGTDRDKTWDRREPLPPARLPVPNLSPNMIPGPLRDWVVDAAERRSWPLEMVAAPAIVALSTVVGCKIGIHPKKFDDWLVVANLWGAVVGRPGVMKSAAVDEGMRFLRRLEAEAKDIYDQKALAASVRCEVLEAEIASIKRAMKGGKSNES